MLMLRSREQEKYPMLDGSVPTMLFGYYDLVLEYIHPENSPVFPTFSVLFSGPC